MPFFPIQAKPNQVRKYPVFPLSDGKIFASKLGLEFRIEPEDSGSLTPKRANRHYNNVLAKSGSNVAKQYRIKCVASMEKEIHTSEAQILLGTSKESSGLHFAGNGAASTITGNYMFSIVHQKQNKTMPMFPFNPKPFYRTPSDHITHNFSRDFKFANILHCFVSTYSDVYTWYSAILAYQINLQLFCFAANQI